MPWFIKLHLKRPHMEVIPLGDGFTTCQNGWDSVEVYFNVDKIETFTDFKVNDIDVCETADEILKELSK